MRNKFVKCSWCGGIIEQAAAKCPNCAGPNEAALVSPCAVTAQPALISAEAVRVGDMELPRWSLMMGLGAAILHSMYKR